MEMEKENQLIQSIATWRDILQNMEELQPEDYYDFEVNYVEVIWLESDDEWILCFSTELFEDGYTSEEEASARLKEVELLVAAMKVRELHSETVSNSMSIDQLNAIADSMDFLKRNKLDSRYGEELVLLEDLSNYDKSLYANQLPEKSQNDLLNWIDRYAKENFDSNVMRVGLRDIAMNSRLSDIIDIVKEHQKELHELNKVLRA